MLIRKINKYFGLALCAMLLVVGVSNITPAASTYVNKTVAKTTTPAVNNNLMLEGDVSITKSNPKVTIALRNSDVQQVLRMFADKAGLNIIFHESAKGKVTLDLVNVPLNNAFKMVLQVADLSYYMDGNTMVVMGAEASKKLSLSKQQMFTIPVNYVDAGVIATFLNKNIFSMNKPGLTNSDIAVTNPSTNDLLIFGTQNDYAIARKLVAKFDIMPKDTTFVVNHTTPKEMSTLVCSMLQNSIHGGTGATGTGGATGGTTTKSYDDSLELVRVAIAPETQKTSRGFWNKFINGGYITGAAVSSSSGSKSSSSSSSKSGSSSSGSGSGTSIAVGESVAACSFKPKDSGSGLTSLGLNGLVVSYFPQRGTINVIGGSDRQLKMIAEFIKKNDVKQPQAYLDLAIISLTETGSKEFTNQWALYSKYISASFSDGTTGLVSEKAKEGDKATYPYPVIFGASPNARYGGPTYVSWIMNYIISNNKGRVLSNPKIVITNGKESLIDLTSDYVKTVDSEIVTAGTGATNAGIAKDYNLGDDMGVKITLTPFISPEGYVTLNLKADYTTEKERYEDLVPGTTDKKTLAATLLSRSNMELSNVRIKDGETLVLGGMIQNTETRNNSKIPFLGDIPVIGAIFRSTTTKKAKSEIVFMITPHILNDDETMAGHSNGSNKYEYNSDSL